MKHNIESFVPPIASALKVLFESLNPQPPADEFIKVASQTFRMMGLHRDKIATHRRKLKDGGYHYFMVVDDSFVIDPLIDSGFMPGNEHPMAEEFKGRGRDPIAPSDEEVSELKPALIARALHTIPKIAVARHRDDPQLIGFRVRDLRHELKKHGAVFPYKVIEAVLKSMEDIQPFKGASKTYAIDAKMTLGDWVDNNVRVVDVVEKLHLKYSK